MKLHRLLITCAISLLALPALADTIESTIYWEPPTHDTAGQPLTDDRTLTHYTVHVSTEPLASVPSTPPTKVVPGVVTGAVVLTEANPGDTLFYQIRACNAYGCSAFTDGLGQSPIIAPPVVPVPLPATLIGIDVRTVSFPIFAF